MFSAGPTAAAMPPNGRMLRFSRSRPSADERADGDRDPLRGLWRRRAVARQPPDAPAPLPQPGPTDPESSFSTADRQSAASQFQIAPSVARARALLAALAAPAGLGCVQKSIQSGFGPKQPGESYELTVTRTDPPPALAGTTAAFH